MNNKRIAVLRGGPSDEYSVSMKTGSSVLRSLNSQNAITKDIVITKNNEWLEEGKIKNIDNVLGDVDLVFIAMHGGYAEDGEIQKILQRKNIPFTGSNSLSSAIAFNKHLTKETLRYYNVSMPEHLKVTKDDIDDLENIIKNIKNSFGPEYIIKPIANGSSIGVCLVRENDSLLQAIKNAFLNSESVLVEEFIRGREASGAILEDFRNESIYTFPALEIATSRELPFFTNEAKYSGETEVICPARFTYQERNKIAEFSSLVHEVLGLSQYSRSDFIVRDGNVYFLEVNTLPGLTEESLYPKAVESVGLSFDQLIEHLVTTARV
jgi:D-alanine-D-alanine ligase